MKLYNQKTRTALRSPFVAPTLGGSVAGVCPQTGFRRTDDAHTQVTTWINGVAPMATGYRSWSPLIT